MLSIVEGAKIVAIVGGCSFEGTGGRGGGKLFRGAIKLWHFPVFSSMVQFLIINSNKPT